MPSNDHDNAFPLIRFDRKVFIYLGLCLLLFIIFTGLKLHNSSIATWNEFLPDGSSPSRGIIAGKPRPVRSDEWMVNSSFILAQYQKGFPDSNDVIGYGKSPLAMGLPTMNVVSIVKPVLWGYYLLDIERAFSWQWNFKIFPFLMASFLFLMLFTKNDFLLSLAGSIILLLSSAIQWWSINTELFTYGFVAVISLIYILFSEKPWLIFLNALLFVLAAFSFAMILYPAYLVPMAYFLLAVLIGYIISHKHELKEAFYDKAILRLSALLGAVAVIGVLGFLFFNEARDTISIMTNTVYPGKRMETGGGFNFLKLFTDNFSWFVDDKKFPPAWTNISELSSFLMLSLIPFIILSYDFIRTRKPDPVLISVVIFQLILIVWFFIGFPAIMAKLTLFSTSPPMRSFYIFGLVNIVLTILFLSRYKKSILTDRPVIKVTSFIFLFIFSFLICYYLNKQASGFFSLSQVLFASFGFTALNWFILHYPLGRFYKYGFIALSLLWILPNARINPLAKGLAPYFENKLFRADTQIKDNDPDAGWVVIGNSTTADFLKAAGIKSFNGVQFAPPLEKLHILDPEVKSDSVYNRYAHIEIKSMIDGQDSIRFDLLQKELYTLWMDPCSPRLNQLGIKYILFSKQPHPYEIRCLTAVGNTGYHIYKRNDL